jgi:hypothetical protein
MADDVKVGLTVDSKKLDAGLESAKAKLESFKKDAAQPSPVSAETAAKFKAFHGQGYDAVEDAKRRKLANAGDIEGIKARMRAREEEVALMKRKRALDLADSEKARRVDDKPEGEGLLGGIKWAALIYGANRLRLAIKESRDSFYDLQIQAEKTHQAISEAMTGADAGALVSNIVSARDKLKSLHFQMRELGQKGFGVEDFGATIMPGMVTDQMRLNQMKAEQMMIEKDIEDTGRKRVEMGEKENAIQDLRVQGRDIEADKAQRLLDLELKRQKFELEGAQLSKQTRDEILTQMDVQAAKEQLIADRKATERYHTTIVASSKAQMGLGGGANVAVFGYRGDAAATQNQVAQLAAINRTLQELRKPTHTKNFTFKP